MKGNAGCEMRLDGVGGLVKNLAFPPSEGAGGFSLPSQAFGFRGALATGLSFQAVMQTFHQLVGRGLRSRVEPVRLQPPGPVRHNRAVHASVAPKDDHRRGA